MNLIDVNQGGVAIEFLRKYLSDMDEYLNIHVGIRVSDMIVVPVLWVDDLVLMDGSIGGMQNQSNKPPACCSKALSVNGTKTKCMAIGHSWHLNLKFNGEDVEEVEI